MLIYQYGRAALDAIAAGVAITPQQYNPQNKEWEGCEPEEVREGSRIRCRVEVPEWSDEEEQQIDLAGQREAAEQYAAFCGMWRGRYAPQNTARMCATGGGIAGRARARLTLARKRGLPLLPAVLGRQTYEDLAALVLGNRHTVGREVGRKDAVAAIRLFPALRGKILVGTCPDVYV